MRTEIHGTCDPRFAPVKGVFTKHVGQGLEAMTRFGCLD